MCIYIYILSIYYLPCIICVVCIIHFYTIYLYVLYLCVVYFDILYYFYYIYSIFSIYDIIYTIANQRSWSILIPQCMYPEHAPNESGRNMSQENSGNQWEWCVFLYAVPAVWWLRCMYCLVSWCWNCKLSGKAQRNLRSFMACIVIQRLWQVGSKWR